MKKKARKHIKAKVKRRVKRVRRKVRKAVSFISFASKKMSSVVRILLIVFQLRILLAVATMGLSLFGWSSWKDMAYWKTEATNLQLELNDRAKIQIRDNRIISKTRIINDKGEEVTFKTTSDYFPPEAPQGATLTIPKDPSKKIRVDVRKMGLTLTPGFGSIYAHDTFQPTLDLKWLYVWRWGTEVGIATKGPTIGLSRHLDDIPRTLGVPWLRMNNLELYGGYQPVTWSEITGGPRPSGMKYFGGIRVNF